MKGKNFVIYRTNEITFGFNIGYDLKWHVLHIHLELPTLEIRFGYKLY